MIGSPPPTKPKNRPTNISLGVEVLRARLLSTMVNPVYPDPLTAIKTASASRPSESDAVLSLISGGLAAVAAVESDDEDADEAREKSPEEAGEDVGDDTADEVAAAEDGAGDMGEGGGDEPEPADSGATPDAQELEDTIRRVLREELAGEMGRRLSQNLQRMIRDEVAKTMLRRD